MENVKEILIEFKRWWNVNSEHEAIFYSDIDKFIEQSKYRPREPEAINRNEQAKESCENCLHRGVDEANTPCLECHKRCYWRAR